MLIDRCIDTIAEKKTQYYWMVNAMTVHDRQCFVILDERSYDIALFVD